jgi:hypothetical protein
MIKLENRWTDLDEICYGLYATIRVLSAFLYLAYDFRNSDYSAVRHGLVYAPGRQCGYSPVKETLCAAVFAPLLHVHNCSYCA